MVALVLARSAAARRASRSMPKGFTLIELMIAVAVIGILSVVGMAQYHLYTGRAQLAEAIELASGRKSMVVEQYSIDADIAALNGGNRGIPPDIVGGVGKYVEELAVSNGTIVATMRSTNVSPCVAGAVLTLTPILPSPNPVSVNWVCTTNASCKPQTCA